MKFHVVQPRELSAENLSEWRSIQKSSSVYQSPFYSYQFTRAVGNVRDDARVAIVEADGVNVGFFPFHRTKRGTGKPIGGPINDYQGPILASEANVLPKDLLEGSGLTAYDYNHLPVSFGKYAERAFAYSVSPQIDLSRGYDDYLAGRSKRWKKMQSEIRRRQRRTEESFGPLTFSFHDTSDASYAEHVTMKNELYKKAGVRSILNVPWVQDVLDVIRHTKDTDFSGMMTTYRAGEKLIAAHFGMRANGVWHYWFPSYDLSLHALGPGISMLQEATSQADEYGIRLVDFGRGDADYKLRFANSHCDLCEGAFVQSGSISSAVRAGQRALVTAAQSIPLGKYESYPRRALARITSGVMLPKI